MKIYALGERAASIPSFLQHVAPGAHAEGRDGPGEWFDDVGNPVTIPVTYQNGAAEVPDSLGRFMIAQGLAKRTALVLPSLLGRLAG